ncbi:uncharacterized protein LOC107703661 isoform X3 [Sinocyclocheilus anshuiensis]|uniref:uncharacterized protein LOC107703661 isoform X3 n=1 Tax=Sinocyclocheilus anshuiensis TaxID=1608454 RepID=UPI0007BA2D24|nr:PREDICTED: uncharacterized protein LOC107703661 isoform X3 [Sinocyclocheilus anshuiensis]
MCKDKILSLFSKMPKPTDVMLTVPVYQQQQYGVSRFLKIKPLALGILELLLALLGLCLTIWNVHFSLLWSPISGVTCFLLMACDTLILIFSVTVALTSCSCCCRPKSRHVEISYMNADLPVNHIVLMGQPDPSAVVQSVSSVMYVLPAVPPAPLPNYSPVPTTPPPAYDQVSAAPPPNYGPVPSAPPPAYAYEDLQTRR